MIEIMFNKIEYYLKFMASRESQFVAGQALFHLSDPVVVVHFIKQGRVHLLRYQSDGAVLLLQRAGLGSVLAEASLYSDVYHCDAVAIEPTVTLTIAKADLRMALLQDPEFSEVWIKHLARELQKARLNAEILSLKTVAQRLDAWMACNDAALPDKGEWRNLANQIGVSPEALYREIAKRK